jgi:VanZ family protein
MNMMRNLKTFSPAIAWWIFSLVLFTMPGSALPAVGWFETLQVDKWVHVFLFFVMVLLFYRPFLKHLIQAHHTGWQLYIPLLAVLYGIVIEVLQHYIIPNRSFDVYDIAADGVGCLLAWYTWGRKAIVK